MRHAPAAVGIGGIVAVTVAADVWAAKTRRPTISAAVASLLDHQVGGPVVVGALAALGWHLAVDPIIRQLSGGQHGDHEAKPARCRCGGVTS